MLKALLKKILRLNHKKPIFNKIKDSGLFDERYYQSPYGKFSLYNEKNREKNRK
jgi:hypothetical protein